jgi:hypothetical protein
LIWIEYLMVAWIERYVRSKYGMVKVCQPSDVLTRILCMVP